MDNDNTSEINESDKVDDSKTKNDNISVEKVEYGDHFERDGHRKVLKSNVEYVDPNGYVYRTDELGRICSVQGDLSLGEGIRNPYAQRTVGGDDRQIGDDGGHLIASQFKGSGQIDNLVPQSSNSNRAGGEWYNMERDWADALNAKSSVSVDIKPIYSSDSVRPDSFEVNYTIDGEIFNKKILNQ